MFFPYPYTDLYNLNLDWMIKTMKEMQAIVEPLSRIVNSVNGMTGDVEITKQFLLGILGNIVSTFNGRQGDVNLTLDDVNGVMVDVLWISAPGDTLADLSQYSLDSLYRNGRRIMIFINNANVPDTVYFLKWVSGHAFPQLYSPTAALAGVASFNGQTGNVTATGSDLVTSDSDSTSIADTLSAQSQQIGDLSQLDVTANNLVEAVNEVNSKFSGVKIIKAGTLTTTGDNITVNITKWFTINDDRIRNTDILLYSLILLGTTSENVLVPRADVGNGFAEMGFYTARMLGAGVTVGFNYMIIRNE